MVARYWLCSHCDVTGAANPGAVAGEAPHWDLVNAWLLLLLLKIPQPMLRTDTLDFTNFLIHLH